MPAAVLPVQPLVRHTAAHGHRLVFELSRRNPKMIKRWPPHVTTTRRTRSKPTASSSDQGVKRQAEGPAGNPAGNLARDPVGGVAGCRAGGRLLSGAAVVRGARVVPGGAPAPGRPTAGTSTAAGAASPISRGRTPVPISLGATSRARPTATTVAAARSLPPRPAGGSGRPGIWNRSSGSPVSDRETTSWRGGTRRV